MRAPGGRAVAPTRPTKGRARPSWPRSWRPSRLDLDARTPDCRSSAAITAPTRFCGYRTTAIFRCRRLPASTPPTSAFSRKGAHCRRRRCRYKGRRAVEEVQNFEQEYASTTEAPVISSATDSAARRHRRSGRSVAAAVDITDASSQEALQERRTAPAARTGCRTYGRLGVEPETGEVICRRGWRRFTVSSRIVRWNAGRLQRDVHPDDLP